MVLGRFPGEEPPDLLICVADATNLRLVLRLILELKHVGRPAILALNMIDIARRQGLEIDLDRLSAEIGMPVIPTVAVRKGGIEALMAEVDRVAFSPAPASNPMRALARAVSAPSGSPTTQRSPPACTMTPGSRTLFEL